MSQKYVIVHFIEIAKVPDEFSGTDWPLHVTLLANVAIDQPLEKLLSALESYFQRAKSFEIMADGEASFGPYQNVAVSLIRPSEDIKNMHKDLIAITTALGAEYDEPAYMGEAYRPHATIQANARLSDTQTEWIRHVTLMDMCPNEDISQRRIIRTFDLANS